LKKEYIKNFGFTHKSGILMAVSSLPSAYGIGNFGKGAYDFVDLLERTGQKCWQVLPLNPTSYGDSPYQSPASMAGNPYFIDPDKLAKEGLLTPEELAEAENDSEKIDYGWLFYTRYELFRKAHARFAHDRAYESFCRKNADWLEDYALFMALKVSYGYKQWTLWANEHKDVRRARAEAEKYASEMDFWRWLQYEFMKQWSALVEYAHSKGVVIVGDIPIYVAHDSVDVWRAPGQFLLDDDYDPIVVAGCPPDAYAEDGQLWGNPIYDWRRMEREGFVWWIERVRASFSLYDILRIDHFRGFASYYTIPFGDENARRGEWEKAPGKKLFEAISAALPKAKIIAEDLGFITDDVRELLTDTGFPGMKVIQFAFYDDDNEYLPRTYKNENCVVYSGSHDADCTASWYKSLDKKARARFRKECPREKGQSAVSAVIDLAMSSPANLCIIPMQDYLELTNEKGRMNTPSTSEGNWQWRVKPRYATKALENRIIKHTVKNNR